MYMYFSFDSLLQKVYNLEEDEPQSLDPYSDDNKAPFYRQPAGLRRARKHEVREELGNVVVNIFCRRIPYGSMLDK